MIYTVARAATGDLKPNGHRIDPVMEVSDVQTASQNVAQIAEAVQSTLEVRYSTGSQARLLTRPNAPNAYSGPIRTRSSRFFQRFRNGTRI